MTLVGKPAPPFELTGFAGGEIRAFSLAAERGRWVILLFYPADFTSVCGSEVEAFSSRAEAFAARQCTVLAISVDSPFAHRAWARAPRDVGGLAAGVSIPLLADTTKSVCRDWGVLEEDKGTALRALFVVDPAGQVVHATINTAPVGRSTREALRTLDAYRHLAAHPGERCLADWEPPESE